MPVQPHERFTPERPCPICGGYSQLPRGEDIRCTGYVMAEGNAVVCTRVRKGSIRKIKTAAGPGFVHRLRASGSKRRRCPPQKRRQGKIVESYDYLDKRGQLLFQVVRLEPKDFRQRQPDGDGGWTWNLKGVRRVPYRLHELLAAPRGATVYIVEGEKDADRLADLGLIATTFPGGAGKWRDEFAKYFKNLHVIILPDNDELGRKHAKQVARGLNGVAASVRKLKLPNLPPKGDVSEWLNDGGTAKKLKRLAKKAPKWNPPPEGDDDSPPDRRSKQSIRDAALLVKLVEVAGVELFHNDDDAGETYAIIPTAGTRKCYSVPKKDFKSWLRQCFYAEHKKPPSAQALQDALGVIEANALYEGEARPVHVRLAEHDNKIYLDLADKRWRVVEITADGWQILDRSPVMFLRPNGVQALPEPVKGGELSELRNLLNLKNDDDWALAIGWLVATLNPKGPFPVLGVHGEQGSAKSTTCRMLRAIIDPNTAPLRSPPKNERDLAIDAHTSWVLAFDNMSHIKPWLSDALCRIATGGGFATRELYTDTELVILSFKQPIMLNGIPALASRGDLQDRSIFLDLPRISDEDRLTEADLWRDFKAAHPRILGALLDAVSCALRNFPSTKLDRVPRMADAAKWIVAAEPALALEPGTFIRALEENRAEASAIVLEASPVGPAILKFVNEKRRWTGTPGELLLHLNARTPKPMRPRGWPQGPRGMAMALRRVATQLRDAGLIVEEGIKDEKGRPRMWTLKIKRLQCGRRGNVGKSSQTPKEKAHVPHVPPTPVSQRGGNSPPKKRESERSPRSPRIPRRKPKSSKREKEAIKEALRQLEPLWAKALRQHKKRRKS